MNNDPNGVTWLPAWKRHGYESYEAWIESKAGASPPRPCGCDFPKSEECECDASCAHCWPDFSYLDKMLDGWEAYAKGEDWPQPQPPPYAADDEDKEAPHD